MVCANCGTTLPDDARFCSICGTNQSGGGYQYSAGAG
ncbi:MAG: zinc-ribbon domain-containing protein, partial [Blastocatellia bacterium]|nr:zinc-ribbon domain-containing protein [Blastocatellia bacterium]